jgi:hypothetical protein
MSVSPEVIVGIIGAIVLGIVLIKLGRQIAVFLLVGGIVAAVVAVALAILNQAEATRQVAQAATVASAGQASASIGVTILGTLLAVVVIGGGLGVAYLTWRVRRAERRLDRQRGQWKPGPNARWKQQGPEPTEITPYGYRFLTGRPSPPPTAYYPPYPMGYAPPTSQTGYPVQGGYPQVVIIDRRDEDQRYSDDDLVSDFLPLWEDDGSDDWLG